MNDEKILGKLAHQAHMKRAQWRLRQSTEGGTLFFQHYDGIVGFRIRRHEDVEPFTIQEAKRLQAELNLAISDAESNWDGWEE